MTDRISSSPPASVGVLTIVLGAYWLLVVLPESRSQGFVRRRLKWEAPDQIASSTQLLKKQQVLSTIGSLDAVLKRATGFPGRSKH